MGAYILHSIHAHMKDAQLMVADRQNDNMARNPSDAVRCLRRSCAWKSFNTLSLLCTCRLRHPSHLPARYTRQPSGCATERNVCISCTIADLRSRRATVQRCGVPRYCFRSHMQIVNAHVPATSFAGCKGRLFDSSGISLPGLMTRNDAS